MATIENGDPNDVALSIAMAPGQVQPGIELRDTLGNVKFSVDKDGNVSANDIQMLKYTTSYSSLQTAIDAICPTYPTLRDPDMICPPAQNAYWYDDSGVLFHPATEWNFTDGVLETSVKVPTGLTLVGAGPPASRLNWQGDSGTGPALGIQCRKIEFTTGVPIINVNIRDLSIRGDWHNQLKNGVAGINSSFDFTPPTEDYRKTGFGIDVSNCRIEEWGQDGMSICGEGGNLWYGRLWLHHDDFLACRRTGLRLTGDVRVVDMTSDYFGKCEVVTDHDLGSIEAKGGFTCFYGAGISNINMTGTTMEGMTETYLGDYSHSMVIEGGLCITVDGHYEEANIYGLSMRYISALSITNSYHQSNEGWVFEACSGKIEDNKFNYMNENANSYNILLTSSLAGLTLKNNYLTSVATKGAGVRFSDTITGVPDYIEQFKSSNGALDADGKFIMGLFIPVQTKAGVPEDTDYQWLKWVTDAYVAQTPQVGIQVFDLTNGDHYIRTATGWKKLTPTA